MRWWDGRAWSDHVTEPSVATPAASAAPLRNTVPATTPVGNIFIWILVLLPVVLIVLRSTLDYGQIGTNLAEDARRGASSPMFTAASGLSLGLSALSFVLAGISVLLAYFDVKRLRATGFERPFPWPWAYFSAISGVGVLVYVIGRTVVVRRRSGRGVAPLVVAIVIAVLGIVLGAVHNVQIMQPFFDQIGNGSFDSGTLDS